MADKIRKAIFPAAGLGTRFLPATKSSPKEMLPLVDKPLIQYAVEEAVASGVRSILIITGRDKTAIEDHFDISFELEQMLKERGKDDLFRQVRAVSDIATISYTRQKQALGLGHAIFQACDFVGSEPFAALLADDIVDAETPALKQMIAVYEKYDAPVVATMQVEGEAVSRFGVIDAEEVEPGVFRIKDMVEKPPFAEAPSDLAIIGRYIFTPDIFEAIVRLRQEGVPAALATIVGTRGSTRRDPDNGRDAHHAKKAPPLCAEVRRDPARRGRQARVSDCHGGTRAQAGRPGRRFSQLPSRSSFERIIRPRETFA